MLTSLPYDEGWQVLLDGEPVEIYKTLDALVAFDTTPGTHTLELRYAPKAFTLGITCTIASTLIYIALCIVEPFWRKKFPMVPVTVAPVEELELEFTDLLQSPADKPEADTAVPDDPENPTEQPPEA